MYVEDCSGSDAHLTLHDSPTGILMQADVSYFPLLDVNREHLHVGRSPVKDDAVPLAAPPSVHVMVVVGAVGSDAQPTTHVSLTKNLPVQFTEYMGPRLGGPHGQLRGGAPMKEKLPRPLAWEGGVQV